MRKHCFLTTAAALLLSITAGAQSKLYPQLFDLDEVTINSGPFLHAMTLNNKVLLEYDAARLLQPYEKQAGLPESGKAFENWGGDRGLDGHVGGHYLSALAIAWRSCPDATVKAQLKERMDQFVNRLKECQDAWDKNENAVMHGYVGGVPHSYDLWATFAEGNMTEYWASWVPLYNIHKTFAGLRDAWLYGDNETARDMFLRLCDWGVNLISGLADQQVQDVLGNEHGGINEMFADAYQMTGDAKYLEASKRYAHQWLLSGMANRRATTIDNVHANTQVPKVIGFERTYQQDRTAQYGKAARFFWTNVTTKRTIAVGGNSIAEWFPANGEYGKFITSIEGVETCNSNNMLKLSEDLFADEHDSKYADFFEGTMYNHILSSQHPETGGYVYFTSARPQHYRVYSQVNQAMWCCVGTGMENHGKYAEFAYVHSGDSLFVNLFMPTTLNWRDRGVTITQETSFPYEQASRITVNKGGEFTLCLRHPSWADGFAVKVNGSEITATEVNGYLPVNRKWKKGDVVEISLPMKVSLMPLQHYTDYVAFKYGPILLGAKTGTDNLDGLFADESRMGHVAGGVQKNIYTAPLLIGSRDNLVGAVEMTDPAKLQFRINGYYSDPKWADLMLEPFNGIHDARYMMYWLNVDGEKWDEIRSGLEAEEAAAQLLEARTIDYVVTGTQQSESDHFMKQSGSNSGSYNGEYYRDGGGWFSYELQTKGHTDNVTLMVRYWGGDSGNRKFDILIDNQLIATETLTGGKNEFVNVEYPVPAELLKDKTKVRVKFQAHSGNVAGGVYYVRLLMPESETGIKAVRRTQANPNKAIYTLDGRKMNTSDPETLPSGIYIVNRTKVVR